MYKLLTFAIVYMPLYFFNLATFYGHIFLRCCHKIATSKFFDLEPCQVSAVIKICSLCFLIECAMRP